MAGTVVGSADNREKKRGMGEKRPNSWAQEVYSLEEAENKYTK